MHWAWVTCPLMHRYGFASGQRERHSGSWQNRP